MVVNKLTALNLFPTLKALDIREMEHDDQMSMLDDIVKCGDIAESVNKKAQTAIKALGGEASDENKKEATKKANELLDEELNNENVELKSITEKALNIILEQEGIMAGGKALIYKYLLKKEVKKK
jgi:hypothetical protein